MIPHWDRINVSYGSNKNGQPYALPSFLSNMVKTNVNNSVDLSTSQNAFEDLGRVAQPLKKHPLVEEKNL